MRKNDEVGQLERTQVGKSENCREAVSYICYVYGI